MPGYFNSFEPSQITPGDPLADYGLTFQGAWV